MTERLVDVDDDKLEQVRALLGATTTKATVNGALDEVLALAGRRRTLIDVGTVAGRADLATDEQRRAAASSGEQLGPDSSTDLEAGSQRKKWTGLGAHPSGVRSMAISESQRTTRDRLGDQGRQLRQRPGG